MYEDTADNGESILSKRIGITHSIREKLHFLDERLWKRFSARRLELIDALDLSSRKASEQEPEIRKVAETLQHEFKYPADTFEDFVGLVRAAVQSVRRNRKRSTKAKKGFMSPEEPDAKRIKVKSEGADDSMKFISEISNTNPSHNYSKLKLFSIADESKVAVEDIILPKLANTPKLPQLNQFSISSRSSLFQLPHLKRAVDKALLNFFERSKSCSEIKLLTSTDNLADLGKGALKCAAAFMLEKSFSSTSESSVSYLRNKLSEDRYLAEFYQNLDIDSPNMRCLSTETAVFTLNILLGGCIKDFGFETIMYTLCEALYYRVVQDHPLISSNSAPFRSADYLPKMSHDSESPSFNNSLSSLAAVASELKQEEPSKSSKKAVTLRFLSSQLEFSYPRSVSAAPRLLELIENAKSAFKLSSYHTLGIKNVKNGLVLNSDADLEKVFLTEEKIDLEVFTQSFHAIPINEITSTIIPAKASSTSKIILPPPLANSHGPPPAFKFLSNQDDPLPPPVLLPRFQPLL